MSKCVLVKKGSNPPLYYVNVSNSGENIYSLSITDADVFSSEDYAQMYCESSEEIQPLPAGIEDY